MWVVPLRSLQIPSGSGKVRARLSASSFTPVIPLPITLILIHAPARIRVSLPFLLFALRLCTLVLLQKSMCKRTVCVSVCGCVDGEVIKRIKRKNSLLKKKYLKRIL